MIRWMSPEKLGLSTTKVSTDFLKQNGLEVVSEWYHSSHGVDLFIWRDSNDEVLKFQLSILGLISEWSHTGGLKTGMILEEETEKPLNKINSSDLIKFDVRPQKSSLDYSIQVLKKIQQLNPEKLEFILAKMDPQDKSILSKMKSWLFKT